MTLENRARNVHSIVSLANNYKMRKSNVKVVNLDANSPMQPQEFVDSFVEMESQRNIHVTKFTNLSSVVAHVIVWSNLISSAKWKINKPIVLTIRLWKCNWFLQFVTKQKMFWKSQFQCNHL